VEMLQRTRDELLLPMIPKRVPPYVRVSPSHRPMIGSDYQVGRLVDDSANTVLDDIVEAIVAVDLLAVVLGGASTDLDATGVEDGGGRAAVAGAAGQGVLNFTEAKGFAARGLCEHVEDLHAGACVFPFGPGDPVVGLVVVLELLAEGDCLGARKAAEGGDA
jgi:hypothetical protein